FNARFGRTQRIGEIELVTLAVVAPGKAALHCLLLAGGFGDGDGETPAARESVGARGRGAVRHAGAGRQHRAQPGRKPASQPPPRMLGMMRDCHHSGTPSRLAVSSKVWLLGSFL